MKANGISYSKQTINYDDIRAVITVLKSSYLTQGPKLIEFENRLARVTQSKFAIAVNSGTAALHIACLAIGLKKDDQVITSPISFAATANCIVYCNAKPVFSDIDEYGLLSPSALIKKINKKTKAIITVDYAGQPSHLERLKKICNKFGLYLIEDAAHSLGAFYNQKPVGSISDLTCFSFHPVKSITTAEGGAVTTNNHNLYKKMLLFRSHGITKNNDDFINEKNGPWYYEMQELGFNYRLSDVQSALGISQLKKLEYYIKTRNEIAEKYNKAFKNFEEMDMVITPKLFTGRKSSWHLYPLRINFNKLGISRKHFFEILNSNNIFPQVHYIPIYKHPYYRKRFKIDLSEYPAAEKFYRQEVSLPLYPDLTKMQLNKVIRVVTNLLNEYK